MAPGVTIDNESDFAAPITMPSKAATRTLLLAPPSVSSHPEALSRIAETHDRSVTDIQMLDRLAMGLVALPAETYDVVLLLTDVDGSRTESSRLLDRHVMEKVVRSMRADGRLRSQSGNLGQREITEAILAGLVKQTDGDGMTKPSSSSGAAQTVTLSFGKNKKKANAAAVPLNGVEATNMAKRKSEDISGTGHSVPLARGEGGSIVRVSSAGVGFVDSHDDFDGGFDDGTGYDDDGDVEMEIPDDATLAAAGQIDPNTLLSEEDRRKPIIVPEACKPNSKRRRACKDCTCGLAERLSAEDKAKRENADANLAKLSANDLNEVDFTVQGKVGSCGNCALGDAFRCDGCPYIGLPAFKPGEEVRLVNNDVQL